MELWQNYFSGTLPPSWSALSKMNYATLSSSIFTGSVPATWSNWSQVREIVYLLILPIAMLDRCKLMIVYAGSYPFAA